MLFKCLVQNKLKLFTRFSGIKKLRRSQNHLFLYSNNCQYMRQRQIQYQIINVTDRYPPHFQKSSQIAIIFITRRRGGAEINRASSRWVKVSHNYSEPGSNNREEHARLNFWDFHSTLIAIFHAVNEKSHPARLSIYLVNKQAFFSNPACLFRSARLLETSE